MARFTDRTALITGGSSGIGYATAQALIAEGARVAITGQNAERLQEAAARLGPAALPIQADGASLADLDRLAQEVRDTLGGLDVLFVNHGIAKFGPIAEIDEATFDEVMAVNVKGAFFTLQKVLPLLRDGASVIFNTSVNNRMGMAGTGAYGPSKAALRSIVRIAAGELSGRGIRVNAVSPGPVETPIYGKLGLPSEQVSQLAEGLKGKIPLQRFGRPEEIAKAVLFLASDDAAFIQGEELTADGGWVEVMP